jgi:hydrogenase/urease accessory protein HupE
LAEHVPAIIASHLSRAAVLVTAALVLGYPARASAHDPGLSALEVHVLSGRVVATLSLAASDRALVNERGMELDALALDAIEIRLDGVRVPGRVERHITEGDAGASVVVAFDRVSGSRLTVRSGVPARLARGHRQLLTVRGSSGALLAERMLDGRDSEVDLRLEERRSDVASQFFGLGLRHILAGYDHLLVLGALLLGVRRLTSVVKTVTAFTVAHSLTLALAVLGIVHVPPGIVEPLIAASISFVGLENLMREEIDSRWKLTFVFGLIHGFGFAGALRELGIGAGGTGVAVPLGAFNIGVEAGQIAVAILVWPLIPRLRAEPLARFRLARACSLLVVAGGAYWLVERILT